MTNSTDTNIVRNAATPSVGMCIYFDKGLSARCHRRCVRFLSTNLGTILCEADDFSDSSFPGCQFRTSAGTALNVKVTGRTFQRCSGIDGSVVRVQIEFVGDGEPSEFCSGWISC